MDYKILSLIIFFVIITIFVSVIVYVIFDNNSSDRRIGNEITITVEIMIGIFITSIIQYNQHLNKKRLLDVQEKQRKIVYKYLYTHALYMQLPIKSILRDWDIIQKEKEKNAKLLNGLDSSNKSYFQFKELIEKNMDLVDRNIHTILCSAEPLYNDYFIRINKTPNDKVLFKSVLRHYQLCMVQIPEKYKDKEIEHMYQAYLDSFSKS